MNAILILIPVTLVLVGVAIWAFFWATNGGQFDDLDTPGLAILGEDDRVPPPVRESPPSAAEQS
jgi:cbb3-type cytochrome oxidase maturation protein